MAQNPNPFGTTIAVNNGGNYLVEIGGLDALIDETITRLKTPFCFWAPQYGIDIENLINAAFNGNTTSYASDLQQQLLLDDRLSAVTVNAILSDESLTVNIQCVASNAQSFTLVGVAFSNIPTQSIVWTVN